MAVQLLPISRSQLRELSLSVVPASLDFTFEIDSLPPSFVAAESIKAIDGASCPAWCSTYCVLRSSDMKIVDSAAFMGAPHMKSVKIGYGMESVIAAASPENWASVKVLQKAAFKLVGSRIDDEDGEVGKWLFSVRA